MPSTPMQHSVGLVMGRQHQHQYQAPSRNQHRGRSTTRGRSTDNAGAGSAQRSPSRNPSVVDRNPSIIFYSQFFIVGATADSSNIPAAIPSPSPPAAQTAVSEMPDEDTATNANINMQGQPVEEDDVHTMSSGSDTD
ncbi:hypothetical protein BYT27DRAFT_7248311 [Phlegmacium glaucopus]|nr:hypothetical protein BYT27DRAFT_7248311 [Phlegmacium glaucopus]